MASSARFKDSKIHEDALLSVVNVCIEALVSRLRVQKSIKDCTVATSLLSAAEAASLHEKEENDDLQRLIRDYRLRVKDNNLFRKLIRESGISRYMVTPPERVVNEISCKDPFGLPTSCPSSEIVTDTDFVNSKNHTKNLKRRERRKRKLLSANNELDTPTTFARPLPPLQPPCKISKKVTSVTDHLSGQQQPYRQRDSSIGNCRSKFVSERDQKGAAVSSSESDSFCSSSNSSDTSSCCESEDETIPVRSDRRIGDGVSLEVDPKEKVARRDLLKIGFTPRRVVFDEPPSTALTVCRSELVRVKEASDLRLPDRLPREDNTVSTMEIGVSSEDVSSLGTDETLLNPMVRPSDRSISNSPLNTLLSNTQPSPAMKMGRVASRDTSFSKEGLYGCDIPYRDVVLSSSQSRVSTHGKGIEISPSIKNESDTAFTDSKDIKNCRDEYDEDETRRAVEQLEQQLTGLEDFNSLNEFLLEIQDTTDLDDIIFEKTAEIAIGTDLDSKMRVLLETSADDGTENGCDSGVSSDVLSCTVDGDARNVVYSSHETLPTGFKEKKDKRVQKNLEETTVDFEYDAMVETAKRGTDHQTCQHFFHNAVMGCLAIYVYRDKYFSELSVSETLKKSDLEATGMISSPTRFIRENNPGLWKSLPASLVSSDLFKGMNVTEWNIREKVIEVEDILRDIGLDISFHLYAVEDTFVYSRESRMKSGLRSVSRHTSSVNLFYKNWESDRFRYHDKTFILLINKGDLTAELYCSVSLDIGVFMYHNKSEIGNDNACGVHVVGDKKVNRVVTREEGACFKCVEKHATSFCHRCPKKKKDYKKTTWAKLYVCYACLTGFQRKHVFEGHVGSCHGGQMSSMIFSDVPCLEQFEGRELASTLPVPLIAALDLETCCNPDFVSRINKDGSVNKSDSAKEAEMIMGAFVFTLVFRHESDFNFTVYRDVSMTFQQLISLETLPFQLSKMISPEDLVDVAEMLETFVVNREEFMSTKNSCSVVEDEVVLKELCTLRLTTSKAFGQFMMSFIQLLVKTARRLVCLRVNRELRMNRADRIGFMRDGVMKTMETLQDSFVELQPLKTPDASETAPELSLKFDFLQKPCGFVSLINNSSKVSAVPELNCVICNRKLDPVYLKKIYENLKYGEAHQISEDGEMSADEMMEECNDEEDFANFVFAAEESSPHFEKIWRGKNEWYVKHALTAFLASSGFRLRQELNLKRHRLSSNNVDSGERGGGGNVQQQSTVENELLFTEETFSPTLDNFVLPIEPDELFDFVTPYSDEDSFEKLLHALYVYIEVYTCLDRMMNTLFEDDFCGEISRFVNKLFHGVEEYASLGEFVWMQTGLLDCQEGIYFEEKNVSYSLYEDVWQRFLNRFLVSIDETVEDKSKILFQKRLEILQLSLLESLVMDYYPEFELELRYLARHQKTVKYFSTLFLDSIVLHHDHYASKDAPPLGYAHGKCNTLVRQKYPNCKCFAHNFTNFDSSLIGKSLPPNLLAHQGKNTSSEWKFIHPSSNKNKIKIMITPEFTLSDSMNFFQTSLAELGKDLDGDVQRELYEMHVNFFSRESRWRGLLERRKAEGDEFSFEKFSKHFKGKLIFPYKEFFDLDWLYLKMKELPLYEVFCDNKIGRIPSVEEHENMAKLYKYFDCKTMADLLCLYTLEDGMLLALKMSTAFMDMYRSKIRIDPAHFNSAAKFSFVACKRLTGSIIQTIPNSSVYKAINFMRRGGFSIVKNQMCVASPVNEHYGKCGLDRKCEQCFLWRKALTDEGEIALLREEFIQTVRTCEDINSKNDATAEKNDEELELIRNLSKEYAQLKLFGLHPQWDETKTRPIAVLDSCISYIDENNQYGFALKRPMPYGNYVSFDHRMPLENLIELQRRNEEILRENSKATITDFFVCLDLVFPLDANSRDRTREEEFNLLVRPHKPSYYQYTEKQLRNVRRCYKRNWKKWTKVSTSRKLISGVEILKRYWLHSSLLSLALNNGWVVNRIHCGYAFSAVSIFEEYIQFNQDERLRHVSENRNFMGMLHKLLNNSLYGWTCRQTEKYTETKLLFNEEESFNFFEKSIDHLCTGKNAIQKALIEATTNPHEDEETKRERIEGVFDRIQLGMDVLVQRLREYVKGYEKERDRERSVESTKNKIDRVRMRRRQLIMDRAEAHNQFDFHLKMKKLELDRVRERGGYEIPTQLKPRDSKKLRTPRQMVKDCIRAKSNVNYSVTLFDEDLTGVGNVCFGVMNSVKSKVEMRSINDVAVTVLAYAKSNIGKMFRLVSDCIPTRFSGADVRVLMSDTDSLAFSVSVIHMLRRDNETGKLCFKNLEQAKGLLSRIGGDVLKRSVEQFLSCSPEMKNMMDRACYDPTETYYSKARKKQVGLYSEEYPLPKFINYMQCIGPKNYNVFTSDGRSHVKHKGISHRIDVTPIDYAKNIILFDKSFDSDSVRKDYDVKSNRTFPEFNYTRRNNVLKQTIKANKAFKAGVKIGKISRPDGVLTATELDQYLNKKFETRSFHTSASGIFLVRAQKVLAKTLSDKALFTRHNWNSIAYGSRIAEEIRKFNMSVDHDTLFTDLHLDALMKMERRLMTEQPMFLLNGLSCEHFYKSILRDMTLKIVADKLNGIVENKRNFLDQQQRSEPIPFTDIEILEEPCIFENEIFA